MIDNRYTRVASGEARPATVGLVAPFLLVAYLIAKPFYFFPSGGPQVADFIAGLLFIVILIGRQTVPRTTISLVWICFLFATYALVINAIWAMLMIDLSMLMTPAFYFFNSVMVYMVLTLGGRTEEGMLKVLLVGIVASVGLQVLLTAWSSDAQAERQVLFFGDNPNRPAYWALLSASIFCVVANRIKIRIFFQILFLSAIFYLVALSLSKAGLVAFFPLIAIHFSRNIGQLFLISVIGVIVLFFMSDLTLMEDVVARLDNIGEQSDDSLHGRGYDRIWLYPQYLFFGAGEQGLSRFPETDIELHSTLGTVLFSYGIIGVYLFGMLLWRLFRLSGWREFIYLAPAFIFGLAHQGLRFTLLWVLFALIATRSISEQSRGTEASRSPIGMNHQRGDIRNPT